MAHKRTSIRNNVTTTLTGLTTTGSNVFESEYIQTNYQNYLY